MVSSLLPFSEAEFEARLRRLQEELRRQGLDALLVVRPENIMYCSGYRASHIASRTSELHALAVPATGQPRLVARALEAKTARTQWTPRPRLFDDHEDPYLAVAELLKEMGADTGAIGTEDRWLSLRQFRRLSAVLSAASFQDVSGLVESLAASPSPAELACLTRAATVTDTGLRVGLASATVGRCPYEVVGNVHAAMYAAGQSDFDKSLVAVWAGPDGGRMHDTLTTQPLREGDVVTVEVMGVDTHYRAGAQACIYLGAEVPPAIAKAHAMVVAMHEAARDAVRGGAAAGSVFDATNAVYRKATGRDYYRRVGGSLGLTQFTTDLVKGRTDELRPGIALLVQTLVDDPVLLTCASTVIVTDDGCTQLTQPVTSLTPPADDAG